MRGWVNRQVKFVFALAAKAVRNADRGEASKPVRDPWAAVLGQIALFAVVSVILSGVALTLWFKPSMSQVIYDGAYVPLRGVTMSEAYASTLDISIEVRGGLLMRQAHQWGTLLFVAAMSLYVLRIFFTGAFRNRRIGHWLLILALLVLGMIEAYLGHLLPDDLLSGTSLRVIEGIVLAVPLVGTPLASLLFGGEFPGDDVISRLYIAHIALPVVAVAFGVFTLVMKRRRARQLLRIKLPSWSRGLMLIVFGVIFVMAATIQVNPVWLWGPFDPANASAGSQPPWYMGFLDGAVRLMPAWSIDVFGHELTLSVLIPAMVIPGLMLAALAAYPWLERWISGDDDHAREALDRPRDMPVRTGLGAGFITFYLVLWIAGGNDVIATTLHLSVNGFTRFLQVALFVLPPLAFWITKRICLGLRLRDRDTVLRGRETGVVVVNTEGGIEELRAPLSADAAQVLVARPQPTPWVPGPAADANGIPNPNYKSDRRRARLSRFYFADVPDLPDSDRDVSVLER
jgi:ubiquinol-cytochrome c reductase cytochrome b subunit